MTCIVGMEYQGKTYIAGDIQGTGWNNKLVHTQPKVFNKSGVIFGYTTSYRFGQILEHNLADPVVPASKDEVYRWLISVFVPNAAKFLKDNNWEKGGNCLIGVHDQLWEMQEDFSVLRSVKGFSAVGSGYEYAMGSMATSLELMLPRNEKEITALLQRAVVVAGTFCPSVGTESVVIST